MLCSHLKMILLLVPLTQLTGSIVATDKCDNSVCNNEAPCEMKDGEPYCQCIGTTYFTGDFCTEEIDNCAANPCLNGAPCTNALGQPVCGPCTDGFSGHFCDIPKKDIFTRMYLHHNRYGHIAKDQKFLFIVESMGSTTFLLEFHADNYAIDAIKTDPKRTKQWHKSSDLPAVARKLGLYHADRLPYQSGFYHITTGRFWNTGLQTLRLKVTDVESMESYMENSYSMQIMPKNNDDCRPNVKLLHCSDPFNPLMLDIGRYNTLHVILLKRCWPGSDVLYDWKVYNSIESVLLHSYGKTSKPRLKVPPYPPWGTHSGELIQSYMIQIAISESFKSKYTYVVSRCYVFILGKPVVAKIIGGLQREVDAKSSIRLDGSPSKDLGLSPTVKQRLLFNWNCMSDDDPDNRYCSTRMSNDKVLTIPKGRLRRDRTYTFTLEVRSDINTLTQDEITQTIKLVTKRPLYVDIECIRNCEARRFTPNQILHLKATCLNCEYQTPQKYTWTVNGEILGKKKRLIVNEANDEDTLTAEVQLVYHSRKGTATIELTKNKAPTEGDCKITPNTGMECETEFEISCEGFEDDDKPLSYEFIAETFPLDRTNDPSTKVHLPMTNKVTVSVCDSRHACTTKEIGVSVTAIEETEVIPFLNKDGRSLFQLLRNGAIQKAMSLAYTAAGLIESLDDVRYISVQMNRFKLYTLLDVEQFLCVVMKSVEKLKPLKSPEADELRTMLLKLASGLENVIVDGEVREIPLKTYSKAESDLTLLLDTLTEQTEDIPPVHTLELMRVHTFNRIHESYDSINISDTQILPRLNIWAKCGAALNKCLKLLGLTASYVHEPEEEKTTAEHSTVRIESFCFEEKVPQTITTLDGVAKITMDSAVAFDLQAFLRSNNALLQVISTPKDPFWWFPDRDKISTGVLYFTGFSSKIKRNFLTGVKLGDPLELTFKLNNVPDPKENIRTHILGRLLSNADMNIFQIDVPRNALLAVHFISTTIDLQVLLELNSKPSGYRTNRSNIFVRKTGKNQPLVILNRGKVSLHAYLGVLPNETISHGSPAMFSIVPELRECLSWSFDLANPQWTTEYCWPNLTENTDNGLQCYCLHMSTYAGRIFPTGGFSLYGVGNLFEHLPFNWYLFCSEVIVGLVFIIWVFTAYVCLRTNRENLVIAPKIGDAFLRESWNGEVIVRITTGGYRNASTTAGVFLTISTTQGPFKFKIYQHPQQPHLRRYSTCTVKLPLDPKVLIRPFSVFLRHDGGGRYPAWYCRFIEIEYEGIKRPVRLKVEGWIEESGLQLSEATEPKKTKHEKWRKFSSNLELLCSNWFFYQPLIGPWKYGNQTCNRFERTLIFILKVALTVLIVAFFFGWTHLENYEEEREKYRYLSFNLLKLFLLSLLTFFIGSILQFGIEYWIFRSSKRSHGSAV